MIFITDIFDELKLENIRLSNELLFANKCLMILYKFKDYLYHNYIDKCDQTIAEELNDTQLKDLENEFNLLMSDKNKTEINNELKSIDDIKQINGLTNTRRKPSEMSLEDNCTLIDAIDDRGNQKNVEIVSQLNISLANGYIKNDDLINKCKKRNKSLVSDRQLRSTSKCIKTRMTSTNLNNSLCDKSKTITSKQKRVSLKCNWIGCDYYAKTSKGLISHKSRLSHKTKRKLVTDFKCNWIECDYYAMNSKGLIDHKNRHFGIRPFKCTVNGCDKSYYIKKDLLSHIRFKHVLQKTIACEWSHCKSMFKTQIQLEVHMRIHLTTYDQRPFKCDFTDCTFRALTQNALKVHIAVHSDEKRFKCEVDGCGKTFKLDITLRAHMRTHRKEPHYKCDWPQCGVTFRSYGWMKQHKMTKHHNIDIETFYCEWPGCDYKSHRKDTISRHRIIHSNERNFSCSWPQCCKLFKTSQNLSEHLKIHMNDRKYKCQWPGCEYSCVQVGNLKKHFDIHCKKLQQ